MGRALLVKNPLLQRIFYAYGESDRSGWGIMNKNNQDSWTALAMVQAAMQYYRILDKNEQLVQMTLIFVKIFPKL